MSAGPHHSVPLTQAQINQQHHQQQQANHLAKLRSRKPTDKNLPDGVEEALAGDTQVGTAYKNLRDLERRLDATLTRKRLDIVDSLSRNAKVCPIGNPSGGRCQCLTDARRYSGTRLCASGSATRWRTSSGRTASTSTRLTFRPTSSHRTASR